MTKKEFEALVGVEVNQTDYDIIETVYMEFDNISKTDIVHIFKTDKNTLLTIMYSKAVKCKEDRVLLQKLKCENQNLADINKKLENITTQLEACIGDLIRIQSGTQNTFTYIMNALNQHQKLKATETQ